MTPDRAGGAAGAGWTKRSGLSYKCFYVAGGYL